MPSLTECLPQLAAAFRSLWTEYEATHPGRRLVITCTHRSCEEQFALYQVGRTKLADGTWVVDDNPKTAIVTQLDGRTKRSKHNSNPAAAIDFAVLVGGKVSWDPREYTPVGRLAEARGLVWGGSWKTLKDYPHVEVRIA